MTSKQRYPFCHGGVLPWTAEFVAKVLNEGKEEGDKLWTTVDVLRQARENAKKCYGI
jgi:TatD DNase family protein